MTTVLVSGANRGLGLEFVKQYLADGWSVIATCRKPNQSRELAQFAQDNSELEIFEVDLADFGSIDELAKNLRGRSIDILINNAGLFGPKPQAEKDFRQSFGHVDYDIFAAVLRVNSLAPLKMAEALFENVLSSEQKKIVTISSQIGSIEEGRSALLAYPTSKAAVNMVVATLARELAPQSVIVTSINPGWVKTDMGGAAASMEIDESIRHLRKLIAGLSIEQSGMFLDYDGRTIPW